jgi:GT2 family glycosyltransferase
MRVGIVFVHYHTPELARRAVVAVERELAALAGDAITGRVVVVDNGSDLAGRRTLAALDAEIVEPGTNLGYAGGVNAGVARLADADALLLANPDVEVLPGSLAALLAALDRAAAAGPRFFWDSGRRLRLPPTEARDPWSEALALLAARSPHWAARARLRWRRRARRHWQAAAEIHSRQLSGALLAVSRAAWDRVGPFDERFQLYFEETDWLERLRRAGLPSLHVPRAEAIHAFGRSSAVEPRAEAWFAASAARFARKHHWWPRRLAMAALARWAPPAAPTARRPSEPPSAVRGGADLDLGSLAAATGPLWVEVSPRRELYPAAGELLTAGTLAWSLPDEVRRGRNGPWWVQVTDAAGRELLCRPLAMDAAAG